MDVPNGPGTESERSSPGAGATRLGPSAAVVAEEMSGPGALFAGNSGAMSRRREANCHRASPNPNSVHSLVVQVAPTMQCSPPTQLPVEGVPFASRSALQQRYHSLFG